MPTIYEEKSRLFLLPIFYFFVSSLLMLAVSGYLLTTQKGIKASFASTNGKVLALNIITEDKELISSQPTQFDNLLCETTITQKIDKYFAKKNAPLEGYGCDMVKAGQKYGVDPVMIAAIAQKESNGGKVTPQFQNKESYNAWGWAVLDNNDKTRELNAYSCKDWVDCINRVTSGIAKKAEKLNQTTKPEEVVTWYNPGSIARANGILENSEWLVGVKAIMKAINNVSNE